MGLRIAFHDLAEIELDEAAQYYESESEGLGRIFLYEVERAVQQIGQYPESSPLINQAVRRKMVRRFPFSRLYSVSLNTMRILAVANQKRRSFYRRGRR